MTKQDEIDFLKSVVDHLPEDAGYLQMIFTDLFPQIESAIRNDMCCIPFRELIVLKTEADRDLKAVRKELIEANKQLDLVKQSAKSIAENRDNMLWKLRSMVKDFERWVG